VVDSKETLSGKSAGIDAAAKDQTAAQTYRSGLVETRCLVSNLRIARANTPELISKKFTAADEKISVSVYVEGSPYRLVGDVNRIRPGDPAIGGPAELSKAARCRRAPSLVLEHVGTLQLWTIQPVHRWRGHLGESD